MSSDMGQTGNKAHVLSAIKRIVGTVSVTLKISFEVL